MFHLFYIALKSVSLISLYRFKTFFVEKHYSNNLQISQPKPKKKKKVIKILLIVSLYCNAIESYCFKGFKDDMALK